MGQSAIMAAIAAKDPEDIRAAMVGELVPVIDADTDPQTWDPRELGASGGNIFPAVYWQEKIWFRDPDDSTTAHDAITCIVTLDASRYLTNDIRVPGSVISATVTTPPDADDSPPVAIGDAYLVPAASSGAWADFEDTIAVWTARGWAFVVPARGDIIYVDDELGYYHRNASDEWEAGFGSYAFQANSVRPDYLLIRTWAFENQTTTTPPATGPAGETYIIGASATGTWSGHDKKIAWRPALDAAFVITTPFTGEEGYDKALAIKIKWNGSAWISAAGAIVGHTEAFTVSGSASYVGSSAYTYSDTVPPRLSGPFKYGLIDAVTLTYTAKAAGALLEFEYSAYIGGATAMNTIALFRDSEVVPVDWQALGASAAAGAHIIRGVFQITALDASSHVYQFRLFGDTSSTLPTRRLARLKEYA